MVGLEPSSRVRDASYLRTHILPVFGDRPLATIGYSDCPAWVNELTTPRAPATVVKAAQIMGKVMKAAVRARRLPYNPMAEVSLPSISEPEDVYLTPAQVETLADAMGEIGSRYRALIWLACYGGPRIGELLALRWSDLDVLRRTVTISRKVIEVSGAGMVEGSTKTKAGRRTVTLPGSVMTELEAHRAAFPSPTLVFTSEEGAQVRVNNLRRWQWASAVRSAGLDGLSFTTCAIRPCRCGLQRGPRISKSRSGPATVRRPSPRAATHTCSPSTARPWPIGSTHSWPPRHPLRRPPWCLCTVSDVHQMCTRISAPRSPEAAHPPMTCGFVVGDEGFDPPTSAV